MLFEKLEQILQPDEIEPKTDNGGKCTGKVFVITGSVNQFKSRKEFQAYVESQGGKVTGKVSKSTDYLVNNDTESSSSKNRDAKALGIPIISEADFLKLFG